MQTNKQLTQLDMVSDYGADKTGFVSPFEVKGENARADADITGDLPGCGSIGLVQTNILRRLIARMHKTHQTRRASLFVGPPGIGKSTAIKAFQDANRGHVVVARIMKRQSTANQALEQLFIALRSRTGEIQSPLTTSFARIQHKVDIEIERAGGGLRRDEPLERFPLLTVVFDEAQRLTNNAIDALRDYNEPHYYCRGTFPIGMIFVGNNELSLKPSNNGLSVLDVGMADRLKYKEQLHYNDVEPEDIALFANAQGVSHEGAVKAIIRYFFSSNSEPRSFRKIGDLIDELHDEALGETVTEKTVRTVLSGGYPS